MMGVIITPTVGSISLDSIRAVPRSLREGAYALGLTKLETIFKVVLPAALSDFITCVFVFDQIAHGTKRLLLRSLPQEIPDVLKTSIAQFYDFLTDLPLFSC